MSRKKKANGSIDLKEATIKTILSASQLSKEVRDADEK